MARKSQPADWEAALSGIKAGDTAREYAAKRDFCAKQREGVMTPQKSQPKVVRANGKGKRSTYSSKREYSGRRLGRIPGAESRTGKPFSNTARTARSSCRETLRIPCGFFNTGK